MCCRLNTRELACIRFILEKFLVLSMAVLCELDLAGMSLKITISKSSSEPINKQMNNSFNELIRHPSTVQPGYTTELSDVKPTRLMCCICKEHFTEKDTHMYSVGDLWGGEEGGRPL